MTSSCSTTWCNSEFQQIMMNAQSLTTKRCKASYVDKFEFPNVSQKQVIVNFNLFSHIFLKNLFF